MVRKWREDKQFGAVVGTVLTGLGAWQAWRGSWPTVAPVLLAMGLSLLVLALLAPRILARPRRLWLQLGEILSFVSTRLILGAVFIGLITPIGLIMRLREADPLGRRSPDAGTRWRPYPTRQHDPAHFEKAY